MKLSLFKKKKKDDGAPADSSSDSPPAQEEHPAEIPGDHPADAGAMKVGADIIKIQTDIDRLKISVEGFTEVRQSFSERMNRMSEQIGELRAMILDRDRTIQGIELKAVKAADLVESVQPDKLMIELQRQDAKLEALKAGIEGNEAIMNRVMEELREVRSKISFFKGIDEIIKLGDEVKKELIDIKKVEVAVGVHADKIDTMYAEIRKKYRDVDEFHDVLQGHTVSIEQSAKDIAFLKGKALELASKEDLDKLMDKVQKYIAALKDLEKKSSMTKDIENLKLILDGMR